MINFGLFVALPHLLDNGRRGAFNVVCSQERAAEGRRCRIRTVSCAPGFAGSPTCGVNRDELKLEIWNCAYHSWAHTGTALVLSGVRRVVRVARPPAGAAVAAPGHVPVQDDSSRVPSTRRSISTAVISTRTPYLLETQTIQEE